MTDHTKSAGEVEAREKAPIERIRANAVAALECLKSARTERDARRYIQQVLDGIDVAVSLGEFEVGRSVPTEAQIKHMVDRFLGWRLPEDFKPDAGISFERYDERFSSHRPKNEPIGTNLFDASQATAMVRYMLKGLSLTATKSQDPRVEAEPSRIAEIREATDPVSGERVEIRNDLVKRLRGQYACGPTLPNGEPEFGWRTFGEPVPIQLEAAAHITAIEAEKQELALTALSLQGEADTLSARIKGLEEELEKWKHSARFALKEKAEFLQQAIDLDAEKQSLQSDKDRLTKALEEIAATGNKTFLPEVFGADETEGVVLTPDGHLICRRLARRALFPTRTKNSEDAK